MGNLVFRYARMAIVGGEGGVYGGLGGWYFFVIPDSRCVRSNSFQAVFQMNAAGSGRL